ncbi:MAG TPA: hypothetical protein VLH94_00950 [Spirochaetia bacterium]|nr:hypothetical protein [Spirochaetia bacterium]
MSEILSEFENGKQNEIGERLEHPENVCLAGSTFMKTWKREGGAGSNPEQIRGDLAIESIKFALGRGFRVVIVDGGSSEDFVKRLGEVAVEVKNLHDEMVKVHDLIVEQEVDRGYSGARRQALRRAEELREEGVRAIVMMEIEKTSITKNVEKLVKPILEGMADVVVPERGIKVNLAKKNSHVQEENEDFRGYPPYQAYSEMWSNKMLNRLLVSAKLRRADEPVLDLFGGTRVIANDPDVLEDFYQKHDVIAGETDINPKMYFDVAYAPIAYLLSKNRKVLSVPIEYHHPEAQTATEIGVVNFDEKRDSQRNMITTEMAKQTRFLGELKRYLALEMRRFPYEMRSDFGILGVNKTGEIVRKSFLAETPQINSSYEELIEKRQEGKDEEVLIEYEGRTIFEYLLDQKFRLCTLNGEDVDHETILDDTKMDFVGSEKAIYVIRRAMAKAEVKKEGLEVCSWGRIYYDKGRWQMAVNEGSELDAAFLMINDILEDYQIRMTISVIPDRNMRKTAGARLFARMFRQ